MLRKEKNRIIQNAQLKPKRIGKEWKKNMGPKNKGDK